MTENICKYCSYFQPHESYCKKLETTKSGKSNCDKFEQSKFAEIRRY